ncbi:MAG: hypothetical protein HYR72_16450 [Deltaproteobacteria bacterium]|nr:hypothetical protein [Deltaproteobacteria bacterium]MBI3389543.1 hypothetical protein [Deltaproteobacteria bacterium]
MTFDPAKSRSTLQTPSFALPLALKGSQANILGKPNADGTIPIAVRVVDVKIEPIRVTGLVCACIRAKEVPAFGPGNSGHGIVGCGADGLDNVNVHLELDHVLGWVGVNGFTAQNCADQNGVIEDGSQAHPHAGLCNSRPVVNFDGYGEMGSALLVTSTATAYIADSGTCATEKRTEVCVGGSNPGARCTLNALACTGGGTCVPAKGPDGIPCNDDDPIEAQGIVQTLTTTTGTTTAAVLHAGGLTSDGTAISDDAIDADHLCGNDPGDHCKASVTGTPYNCAQLANGITMGAASVSAFASVDVDLVGDEVVTSTFTAK